MLPSFVFALVLLLFAPSLSAQDVLPEPGAAGDLRVCLSDQPLEGKTAISSVTEVSVHADGQSAVVHTSPRGASLTIERRGGQWLVEGESFSARTLELRPMASPGIGLNGRVYRGTLRLVPFDNRRFWAINILPVEHYLCSVIDGEIPGTFHNEARKAQNVSARTYALRRRKQNAALDYDVWASPVRDQNYHGYQYRGPDGRMLAGESAKSRQAVRETLGLVLIRNGELARTYYSACCGGVTSAGTTTFPDATEMTSVVCDRCGHCPKYRWTSMFSTGEFSAAVRKAGGRDAPPGFEVAAAETIGADDREVLPRLVARDAAGTTVTVDTRRFRTAVTKGDVHSAWFEIERTGDGWTLRGRGHGHGVGLCQWGADGFAQRGTAFDAILKHFYPGVEIEPLRD
jgi:stage II sporulation protein D